VGEQNLSLPTAPSDPKTGQSMRRSLTVDLSEEGIYGFYLLVKSGAGLCKPPPVANDPPQFRLEVDTTPPEAELYRPDPDPVQKDSLIIAWKANDRNLTQTPITIQWAERPAGPWESIGPAELPNTGRFSWQVPANIPPRVYLRLTVRDQAGNVAVAETPQPVLVDLAVPDVKLIGISGNH
jgi:hypothetical protein